MLEAASCEMCFVSWVFYCLESNLSVLSVQPKQSPNRCVQAKIVGAHMDSPQTLAN